ncbi:hypothetical protein ACF060_31190 [Streptomyces werraensis]|uniref:hypothetical protein n=1 Tax=Streptomyces werraensis TaxID=68284 RepID=UPI0036F59AD0
MTTPAEELRDAVFALNNSDDSGPAWNLDETLRKPLAAWLAQTADLSDALPAITATNKALAVARAINGTAK